MANILCDRLIVAAVEAVEQASFQSRKGKARQGREAHLGQPVGQSVQKPKKMVDGNNRLHVLYGFSVLPDRGCGWPGPDKSCGSYLACRYRMGDAGNDATAFLQSGRRQRGMYRATELFGSMLNPASAICCILARHLMRAMSVAERIVADG
ncbi:hypothetical protein [Paracoccus sp. (in: a-proteobacteria)]|uniref:hypothetical protein n=1 Tax=Paracoccus sp. TaxID=267 RepID=UPI002AFF959D|nr:hypothetical protein [Paracoccus sp. (in: a-proteobacteria)]